MDTLLEVKDLCKQYKGAGNYMAVYHMNLSIPRGKIIGLLGHKYHDPDVMQLVL